MNQRVENRIKSLFLLKSTKKRPATRLVSRYSSEIAHCVRLGATMADRASLARETLAFHLQNFRGKLACSDGEEVRHCQIRLKPGERLVDFYYRVRGGDLFILHEVLLGGCYRIPPVLREPVSVVIDLGANIGSATLSLARQFPEATFVCVEPDPRNANILARNVACLGERVHVIEGAIADRDGMAGFATTGLAWQGQLTSSRSNGIQVPCCRLETLLERNRLDHVDVLKVDTEGAESGLFSSRGEWWEKVKLIIAELHSPYSFEEFERDMRANGFKVFAPGCELGNMLPMAIRHSAQNF